MSSTSNTPYITLLGLVLLLNNWIVSKFHCSNVITPRCLGKGIWWDIIEDGKGVLSSSPLATFCFYVRT